MFFRGRQVLSYNFILNLGFFLASSGALSWTLPFWGGIFGWTMFVPVFIFDFRVSPPFEIMVSMSRGNA